MTSLALGVLDQSPISSGSDGAQALRNSVELAQHTEALGYGRYWVAEHHGGPMLAGAAPEVLIGAIAGATSTLRVGSGGVMLPHYAPLKVAETFSILAGLYGERIDLGIGRAAGTDPITTHALQRDRRQAPPDDFPDQLAELLALLEDRVPPSHPFARLSALPGGAGRPEVWLLGSSPQSAIWAAQLGLPYAFADFINPLGAPIAADYRERFTDSERLLAPRTVAAVNVICAETDEQAQELAMSGRMAFTMLRRGQLIPIPPPDRARAFFQSEGRDPLSQPRGRRGIVGSPETVRAGIEQVAAEYGADEILVVTITYEHAARLRSYELVAEAAGLTARATPPAPAAVA